MRRPTVESDTQPGEARGMGTMEVDEEGVTVGICTCSVDTQEKGYWVVLQDGDGKKIENRKYLNRRVVGGGGARWGTVGINI